jgi:hypothetical protein
MSIFYYAVALIILASISKVREKADSSNTSSWNYDFMIANKKMMQI